MASPEGSPMASNAHTYYQTLCVNIVSSPLHNIYKNKIKTMY